MGDWRGPSPATLGTSIASFRANDARESMIDVPISLNPKGFIMKDFKMSKEWMQHKAHKLYHKRNFYFKAFLVNYIAVFVAWIFTMMPAYHKLLMHFLPGISESGATMYMMELFGIWKILGFVLFLVPAFAAWWELHSVRKWLEK